MYFYKSFRCRRLFFPILKRGAVLCTAAFVLSMSAGGQLPSASQGGGGSRAAQLPLSGRQQGGPSVQQSAAPPPTSSVNTINTQIQVQGAYSGSVPGREQPTGAITLTLAEAVRRGLETNLGLIGADSASRQARAQRLLARSALLPDVSASVAEDAAKVNLAAEGFSASDFGNLIPFQFPTTVGPFHYYDLHGSLQQDLIDFTAIHNLRSANHLSAAAGLSARQAREEVVLAVAGEYLQLMATVAMVEQERVEVQYAETSYKQAQAHVDAGNKAPIDANRSMVELQTEQQRLRSLLGNMEKEKHALARLIGLPLSVDIQLTERLTPLAPENPAIDETVRRAWMQRQDLKAAEAQLRAAEEARKAAGAERLPSASLGGTYGLEGVNPDHGASVFQASASISVPLFQGGRISADVGQADAVVAQRRAELADERGAVELDVRNACIDLGVANDQVHTAESNQKLAIATLQQSQDRFSVGVADSVEVVNSQEALASADHDYVSSLFSQYLARITLARAMGEAERDLPDLFKGTN